MGDALIAGLRAKLPENIMWQNVAHIFSACRCMELREVIHCAYIEKQMTQATYWNNLTVAIKKINEKDAH